MTQTLESLFMSTRFVTVSHKLNRIYVHKEQEDRVEELVEQSGPIPESKN